MVSHQGKTYIIIVAAGSGMRFGAPLPKQYAMLMGRPVLVHSVESFRRLLPDAEIAVAINPDYERLWNDLWVTHGHGEKPRTVYGGASRAESVHNAMCALAPEDDSIVMVHDGARPVVSEKLLSGLFEVLTFNDAAVPAIVETDTIRRITSAGSETVDRNKYFRVQTPQAFRASLLKPAYRKALEAGFGKFTDDASVAEAFRPGCVALTEGDVRNIKITHPLDLAVAEVYLRADTTEANAQSAQL